MTSASFGIDASPLATLRTRSSSTMTTALVKTFPVPSTNFPNLMALVAATAVEDVARKNRITSSLVLRMRPPEICHRERRRPSEVARIGRVIAIPVFHASIFGFYKTQTAPMGTVPHRKAPRLDGIARFEIVGRHANPLKCRTANGLHNPYLRIARCILNLNVYTRVRYDKMHFLHYAFNVRISVGVVAGRMVRRCRDGEHQRRNCHKAENRFERHAHLSQELRKWMNHRFCPPGASPGASIRLPR